jgi:hypothetical protein
VLLLLLLLLVVAVSAVSVSLCFAGQFPLLPALEVQPMRVMLNPRRILRFSSDWKGTRAECSGNHRQRRSRIHSFLCSRSGAKSFAANGELSFAVSLF